MEDFEHGELAVKYPNTSGIVGRHSIDFYAWLNDLNSAFSGPLFPSGR